MTHWFYWGSTVVSMSYMLTLVFRSRSYIQPPAVFFSLLICFLPVVNTMLTLAIVVAACSAIGNFLTKGKF